MRLLVAAAVLVPSLANAQPGVAPVQPVPSETPTSSAEVMGLARGAHIAGERGDCVGARVLSGRIMRLDRDFYDAVISTDPSITQCKPKPRVYAVDPAPPPPPPMTRSYPYTPIAPVDTGRNLGGQLLLGGVMGAGLGFLGGVAAFSSNNGEDEGSFFILTSLGLIAGTSAGVIIAGDNTGSDYSLGLTLAGSTLGTMIGWKLLLDAGPEMDNPVVAIGVLVGAPTLGAMLGFNAGRTTRFPTASTQVAVPVATRISDPTTSMPVISGSF